MTDQEADIHEQIRRGSAGASELWQELGEALQRAGAAAAKIASVGTPPPAAPKYVSTLEAAQALGITVRTLTRYGDDGCPCVRLKGGRRRWDVAAVKAWLDARGEVQP